MYQIVDSNDVRIMRNTTGNELAVGMTRQPDGHTLYASGGNRDCVYVYAWGDSATLMSALPSSVPGLGDALPQTQNKKGAGSRYTSEAARCNELQGAFLG